MINYPRVQVGIFFFFWTEYRGMTSWKKTDWKIKNIQKPPMCNFVICLWRISFTERLHPYSRAGMKVVMLLSWPHICGPSETVCINALVKRHISWSKTHSNIDKTVKKNGYLTKLAKEVRKASFPFPLFTQCLVYSWCLTNYQRNE